MAKPTANAKESDLARAICAGDRRALARAITLVESTRAADREKSEWLLTSLLPKSGQAMRIGISGAPGVGKSTFIEAFGAHLTSEGRKVAVLVARWCDHSQCPAIGRTRQGSARRNGDGCR